MKDYFDEQEAKKNQWHCSKCNTNWLSYVVYYDTCPFCGAKNPALVRIGTASQNETAPQNKGTTEWWDKP
jgi:Zn finger protein HypA/HybF involved in hydrogenase expression